MHSDEKILIVDDDARVLDTLLMMFKDDYTVVLARSGAHALELLSSNESFDAIVLDIKMAQMDGLQTATRIKEITPDLPLIFHTAFPGEYSEEDIEQQFEPFDYVGKDERPARLQRAVRQAVKFSRYRKGTVSLVDHALTHFNMVGQSRAMLEVYQTIEKIGPTGQKVIIYGATGTGKELVASAIHKMSQRAGRELVICNCNPRNPDLVETQLFGHLKGAFTGAGEDRIGLFDYANGSTLFLDEVGDLAISTQGRLLRVLETGEMQRVGSPENVKVDVRVVCATHRDLAAMVEQGEFRKDLYYRLKGVTIRMPDLKDRPEDIPMLINHFIDQHCHKQKIARKLFEPAARDLLVAFEWPGNVRQLMDTIQSLIDLSPSQFITYSETAKYLGVEKMEQNDNFKTLNEHVREFKRRFMTSLLDRNKGNMRAAAREISMDPSNLRKLIKELGLI